MYKKLNSTGTLIQRTTTEAPHGHMYYIGLDVHKKTISYCVKDVSGRVHQEGKLGATPCELDIWMRTLPQRWTVAMEATIFTGWIYDHLGFAVETHDSGEYRYVRGKAVRNRERIRVRGLKGNYNRDLKNLFKSTAISASTRPGPLRDFYLGLLAKGMRPTMAGLALASKIAAITLTIWKKGVDFDANQLDQQAA